MFLTWSVPDLSVSQAPVFLFPKTISEMKKKVDVFPKVKQWGVGPIAKSLSPISEPIMDEDEDWFRTFKQNILCAPDNLRAENWEFGGDWGLTSEPVKQKLKWIARIYKPKDSQNDVKWFFPSVYLFQWIQSLFVILQFSIINTQTVGKSILAKPKGSSWGRREKSI